MSVGCFIIDVKAEAPWSREPATKLLVAVGVTVLAGAAVGAGAVAVVVLVVAATVAVVVAMVVVERLVAVAPWAFCVVSRRASASSRRCCLARHSRKWS